MADPAMAIQGLGEDLQKAVAVLVVEEYRRAAVTTGGYVRDDVRGADAKWTGHSANVDAPLQDFARGPRDWHTFDTLLWLTPLILEFKT